MIVGLALITKKIQESHEKKKPKDDQASATKPKLAIGEAISVVDARTWFTAYRFLLSIIRTSGLMDLFFLLQEGAICFFEGLWCARVRKAD